MARSLAPEPPFPNVISTDAGIALIDQIRMLRYVVR
jgi:hypothetical protein